MREFIPLNAYMPVRIGKRGINTPDSPIPRTIIGRAIKVGYSSGYEASVLTR